MSATLFYTQRSEGNGPKLARKVTTAQCGQTCHVNNRVHIRRSAELLVFYAQQREQVAEFFDDCIGLNNP